MSVSDESLSASNSCSCISTFCGDTAGAATGCIKGAVRSRLLAAVGTIAGLVSITLPFRLGLRTPEELVAVTPTSTK